MSEYIKNTTDKQLETISDQEIIDNVSTINTILNSKIIPQAGKTGLMARISYYGSSSPEEMGFITSTIGEDKDKLISFKNGMDTLARHLREVSGKKFKLTVAECKKRIESERILTNREKEIFDIYEHIDDQIDVITDLIEDIKNLDFANKLNNTGYYGIAQEHEEYGKEALMKMQKLTQLTQDLGIQMNFLEKDIIHEGLGIKTEELPQLQDKSQQQVSEKKKVLRWLLS